MKNVSITLDLVEYAYIQFVINKYYNHVIDAYKQRHQISIISWSVVTYTAISLKSKFDLDVTKIIFSKKGKRIQMEISQLIALYKILMSEDIDLQELDEDLTMSRAILRKLDEVIVNYNPTIP